MRHIEKALALAEKYEKLGDKKKAARFLEIAERYEEHIGRIKEKRDVQLRTPF